jgi:predicted CXXCH cytochrome family protein
MTWGWAVGTRPQLICVALALWAPGAFAAVDADKADPLPFFEDPPTPCGQCHEAHVPSKGTPHELLGNASCTSCHNPSKRAGGACKSDQARSWSLAATEARLCGKCHVVGGTMKKHKPLADGKCSSCHVAHGSAAPRFLKSPPEALCASCHPAKTRHIVSHAPVNSGECLVCHDPHAGRANPLLVERRDTLCLKCHDVSDLSHERVKHTAVKEGHCSGCHDPHGGPARALLKGQGEKLCLPCHDAKAPRMIGSASGRRQLDLTKPFVHKPLVKGECQYCHTQKHGSEHKGLLSAPAVDSCYKCHKGFDQKHKYLHGAVKLGDCAVCHDPHSSNTAGILREDSSTKTCFRCHEDDVTGRNWVHKPITETGCSACHDPHGAASPNSLKKPLEKNVLCLGCHKGLGDGPVKHRAVSRDGCGICHDPHGSAEPSGLRTNVYRLCVTCHPDQNDGQHIGAFAGKHKVLGGPDRRREGKEFSCVSCHDPHASASPKLLRSGKDPQESCKMCH